MCKNTVLDGVFAKILKPKSREHDRRPRAKPEIARATQVLLRANNLLKFNLERKNAQVFNVPTATVPPRRIHRPRAARNAPPALAPLACVPPSESGSALVITRADDPRRLLVHRSQERRAKACGLESNAVNVARSQRSQQKTRAPERAVQNRPCVGQPRARA
jgi:hypothetical protein